MNKDLYYNKLRARLLQNLCNKSARKPSIPLAGVRGKLSRNLCSKDSYRHGCRSGDRAFFCPGFTGVSGKFLASRIATAAGVLDDPADPWAGLVRAIKKKGDNSQ